MYTFIFLYFLSITAIIVLRTYFKSKSELKEANESLAKLRSIERNCFDYYNHIADCLNDDNQKEAELFLKYLEEEVIKGELIAEKLRQNEKTNSYSS